LHHDQVGDGSQNGEIAGERRCHSHRQPGRIVVVQRLDERLQHQDRRDVADQVGQHGRHQAQHRNLVETKPPHGGYHVRRQQGVLRSAHDVADGGLVIALAESALFGSRGVRCPSIVGSVSRAALYFGESQARVVVSVTPRRVPELQQVMAHHQIPLQAVAKPSTLVPISASPWRSCEMRGRPPFETA